MSLFGVPVKITDGIIKYHQIIWPYKEVVRNLGKATHDFQLVVNGTEYGCSRLVAAACCPEVLKALSSNSSLSRFELSCEGLDVDAALKGNVESGPFQKLTYTALSKAVTTVEPMKRITTNKSEYHVHQLFVDVSCDGDIPEKLDTDLDLTEPVNFLRGQALAVLPFDISTVIAGAQLLRVKGIEYLLESIRQKFERLTRPIAIISIENWAYGVTQESYQATLRVFRESEFFKNPSDHCVLIEPLLRAPSVRPKQAELIRDLLLALSEDETFRKNLKDAALSRVYVRVVSKWLLRQLMVHGIYTIHEVISSLQRHCETRERFFFSPVQQWKTKIFFLPELLEISPQETRSEFESIIGANGAQRPWRDPAIGSEEILQQLLTLSIDELRAQLDSGLHPDPIIRALYNDDCETFQMLTSQQPNFDFKQEIQYCLFDRTFSVASAVSKKPRICDLALLYNAEKCLNFIFLNGNIADADALSWAAQAGNTQWLRTLQTDDVKPSTSILQDIIEYHRNDLYPWLLNEVFHSSGPILSLQQGRWRVVSVLNVAIENGNFEIALDILERHYGVNDGTTTGSADLIEACKSGHTEIVRLMLSFPDIDVNEDWKGVVARRPTPLKEAIREGFREITRLLLNHPEIHLHDESDDASPLTCAIQWQDFETAKFLIERLSPGEIQFGIRRMKEDQLKFIQDLLPK